VSRHEPSPRSRSAAIRGGLWRLPYGVFSDAVARLGDSLSSADAPPQPAAADHPPLAPRAPQTIVVLDTERCVRDAGEAVEQVLGRPRGEVVGHRLDLIRSSGGNGRLEVRWPDGTLRDVEFSATPTRPGAGQLVALRVAGTAAGAEPPPALREPKLAVLAELLGPRGAPAADLDAIAGRIAATLGTHPVGFFRACRRNGRLRLRAGAGWDAGSIGRATASGAPGAPIGRALAASEPVVIGDLGRAAGTSTLLQRHGVVSGIEVAIGPGEDAWGVLGAYATSRRRFEPDEIDFLAAVAATLAPALDRGPATEPAEAIRRRTRADIAQRLHDEALQSLLAARQYLASVPGEDRSLLHARAAVTRATRELRAAVGELHPAVAEGTGLREAIDALVRAQSSRGGFAATVDLAGEADSACAPLLLTLIRELLANVAEHAQARNAHVRLRRDAGGLTLEVADDGVGIPAGRLGEALAEGHIGLASARRRAEAAGGSLSVDSAPGAGTRVRVRLAPGPAGEGARSGHN
jgi:signal transduction histidine kinase